MMAKRFDLQGTIDDWAREYFERKATRKERKWLNQDSVAWTVDWKNVTFAHEPTEYNPEPPTLGEGHMTDTVLFHTTFTNKTSVKQKYTFRVQRSTRSTCSLEVEQGYTTGVEMNVKVTTPCQILEACANFKREMTLNKIEGQTIEQEMSWGTDSEIEVDPRSVAEAKLKILEEEYDGRFTVKTRITGRVRIVYNNIRDNNSYIKTVEGDLVDIVRQAVSSKRLDANEFTLTFEGRALICVTRGRCHFRYGVKQMAEVDQSSY